MQIEIIRGAITISALIFVAVISLSDKQDSLRNWAMFFSLLYTAVCLPLVNLISVNLDFWHFTPANAIEFPYDIYFIWTVVWGIIPIYFLRKKYFFIILLSIFWIDIALMPVLQELGILTLNENWLIGELMLIGLVFVPAYWWAYCFYHKIHTWFRAICQVTIMIIVFLIELPYILYLYDLISPPSYEWSSFYFQLLLIIAFPGLFAVQELVKRGKGTPFPYDPTSRMVTGGVYGYCRNPIQWTFAFMFIPLSLYYSSYYFLLGALVSVAYSFGVSDFQEYPDMEKRYGQSWTTYKNKVPKWYFLWYPKEYPQGTIYFDLNCNQCTQISKWFLGRKTFNLHIENANEYEPKRFLNATYIDANGQKFKSVAAIASAFEHINLAYASLGWFMRFTPVNFILQAIVDSMQINRKVEPDKN